MHKLKSAAFTVGFIYVFHIIGVINYPISCIFGRELNKKEIKQIAFSEIDNNRDFLKSFGIITEQDYLFFIKKIRINEGNGGFDESISFNKNFHTVRFYYENIPNNIDFEIILSIDRCGKIRSSIRRGYGKFIKY